MILDIQGIQKILPHRYPFLLVDTIEEMESKKRVVGVKNVTINEPFFQGHFPAYAVMPGVLIIEAMAQTGGVLLLSEVPDRDKKVIYLVAVDNVRFRRPVVPGDQLKLELIVTAIRDTFCRMDAKARVNGDVVAEASMMCKMVDLADLERPAAASTGQSK
jgi:beta-hydroxyacyl-ACP dehydratase FabZ